MPANTTSTSTTHSTTGGTAHRILPGLAFRPRPNPGSSCATGVNGMAQQQQQHQQLKKKKGACGGGGVSKIHRRKKFDLDGLKEGAMEEMLGLEYDEEGSVTEG
ncbi:hypothetical protein CERZMDRAFT_96267 [Cercospora zeae-maydis SCOH1-5]|uniref:Uncharacterized protein n=1 Tax=Cercospora zeae-maydis SCOH1-5 TaxID=717836 RepID=A0A6A6FJ32_9PEZI|nr:hypothetical protein CERZMDRAFT_96267 [Cercospora zeae-maydis SCOH1-5]